MIGAKEGISGTKEKPIDSSVQAELKKEQSSSSPQPAAVQRTAMEEAVDESRIGRQEPDADGSTSLADSEETTEAIRKSPRAELRRGKTRQAVVKPTTEVSNDASKAVIGKENKTHLEENFSHFESNNGNF